MVSMCSEKPICAPPRLSELSFPNVAFETVSMSFGVLKGLRAVSELNWRSERSQSYK